MQIDAIQQVFMLFFAIFWGAVANVQPRWRAFHWPMVGRLPQARHRAIAAVIVLAALPIVFFAYGMWALQGRGPADTAPLAGSLHYAIRGVLPAFGFFGLYRLWLALIELRPDYFYASKPELIDEDYRHTEPTYRYGTDAPRPTPTVDIGRGAGPSNLRSAILYLIIAAAAPWCPLPSGAHRVTQLSCSGVVYYGQNIIGDKLRLQFSGREVHITGDATATSTFEDVLGYTICAETNAQVDFQYATSLKCGSDATRTGRIDKVTGKLHLERLDRGAPFVGAYDCKSARVLD